MERKNTVLLTVIAVATLLVAVVGATFAYFTATSTSGGTGGSTNVQTTANTSSVNLNLSPAEKGLYTYLDYPGGVGVSSAQVQATAEADTYNLAYDLTLKFTNTTGTDLTYTLYKSTTPITTDPGCDLKTENATNATTNMPEVRYSYDTTTCNISAYSTGTTVIKTDKIAANTTADTMVTIDDDTNLFISTGNTNYYYLVVEYPNSGDQTTTDVGRKISAQISGATNVIATKVSS